MIVLRPDDVDLSRFFSTIPAPEEREPVLTKPLVGKLLDCVETEWDKKVIRVLISLTHTYSEMTLLGLDPHNIAKDKKKVMNSAEDIADLAVEAESLVAKNLVSKLSKLKERVSRKRNTLLMKNKWTETQIQEYEEDIEDLELAIKECGIVIGGGSPKPESLW